MSLILDALSRSQRERGGDVDVPGIDTQHYRATLPQQSKWRAAIPWIALGLALVVILFLLTREEGILQPVENTSSTAIADQATDIASKSAPAPREIRQAPAAAPGQSQGVKDAAAELQRAGPASPVTTVRSDTDNQAKLSSGNVSPSVASPASDAVAALYETPPQVNDVAAASADPLASAPAARDARTPAQGSVDSGYDTTKDAESDAQTSGSIAAGEVTEPIDMEALLARAEQEVAQSRLSEHPAPFLEQLSQMKKDQIPTLMYSRHDYSSQASQSSVLINGKTVKVGATVAPGVRLDEILPDSSVFSYRGESFRLIALNSWVNL